MSGENRKSGLAITSMVLGIVSMSCFGILTGLPAIILGHIAHNRARRSPESHGGSGFAIAGFVMGYVSILSTFILAGMLLPALAKAKERAQSINCITNLKMIGTAGRMYANSHNGKFPENFSEMKQDIDSPKWLICPRDPALQGVHPTTFDVKNISYEIVTTDIDTKSDPQTIFVRCPFHEHVCQIDGTVVPGKKNR